MRKVTGMTEMPSPQHLRTVARNGLSCAQCESRAVDTVSLRHSFRYGAGESAADLTVELPVRRCAACGFEFLDHESEKVKLEAICEHLDIVSPMGMRRIRERYGMTQAEFAEVTGLGTATLVRWENGSMNHTRAYDRYVRLLANPDVMARLRKLVRTSPPSLKRANILKGPWRAIRLTDDLAAAKESFNLRAPDRQVAA